MTITIDRGHYDCAGTNYAVIGVRTTSPIHYNPQSQSFYCSFFSHKATRDMGTNALHPHWLGNCSVFLGADFETHVLQCSYRHESGHVKTWRKANQDELSEDEDEDEDKDEAQDQEDAVSVDPFPPANTNPSPKRKPKFTKSLNPKDNQRIIQLQKKNLLLRTELDALKANLEAMKADICTIKAQLGATNLTQRLNEQEVWIKRANQCMQDWTNKGVIDRVWILETQHAYLRSEHLKHKEQQQQQQRIQSQIQPQQQIQQPQQPQQNKCCKSLRKKLKKQHTQHESVCSEMLERLTRLEANEANRNVMNEPCNKCNDDKCNDENKENYNPFAFSAIYDHYDQSHYMENTCTTHDDDDDNDECPALDLIVNHYAATVDVSVPVVPNPDNDNDNPDDDNDDAYDDDMFELIQISNFDLPLAK